MVLLACWVGVGLAGLFGSGVEAVPVPVKGTAPGVFPLALARAMLLNPPILLLDDPTSAVDAETDGP